MRVTPLLAPLSTTLLAGLLAGPGAVQPGAPAETPATAAVRVMAANISSGRLQSYPNPGPGERIFRALAPDVVLIQEFNVNATREAPNDEAAVRAWVDDVFGPDYFFFREPGAEQIPNGVISRWPIVEAGEFVDPEVSNRDFAFARIDVPGEVDLWVVSVHLLTSGSGVRDRQARRLVEAVRQRVPAADYLVIGGDFNTAGRNEPAVVTLGELVDVLGPFPDDGADPPDGDTNASRRKPFDWVLVDGDLEAHAAATEIGELVFPAGLVFDSRVFTTDELEESFPPVERGDSGAQQMQHMAVVRDFLLPLAGAAPLGPVEPVEPGEGEPVVTGEALDLGGFRLEQTGGDAVLVFPAGTLLAPGALLVVGRDASREAFETFWGALGPGVVYLDGRELAGDPGFPIVNGDERYRLLDAGGQPVDPAGTRVPPAGVARGRNYQRDSTAADAFAEGDELAATPGRFDGARAGTGRLVITEVSDARQFEFEFVELLFDAAPPPGPQ